MKRLILTAFLTFSLVISSFAQEYRNAWGVSLGYENTINQTDYTTYRYFHGFNIGGSYKIYLWKGLNITPDVRLQVNDNYGNDRIKGFKWDESKPVNPPLGDYTYDFAATCNDSWDMHLQIRPTAGYRYKWIEIFTGPRLDIMICHGHKEIMNGAFDAPSHTHSTEMYWNVGIAGHYRNFSLAASFNQPLYPSKHNDKEWHQAPRTIDFTLTYRFNR